MHNVDFFQEANSITPFLRATRRKLHQHAETGFALSKTLSLVQNTLQEFSIPFQPCGQGSLLAVIGRKKANRNACCLLRADMDALPLREETNLKFRAKNGNMHACGHDMHTAMLLGTARLLKAHEKDFDGQIVLLFQGAEESLEGAKDVLTTGALRAYPIQMALSLHVLTASPFPTGTALVSAPGIGAPAAEFFTIETQGKGCHGSMPHDGIDALNAAAHILLALQTLSARELAITDEALLTIGALHAGSAGNVIADKAVMLGTLRSFDDNLQKRLRTRMQHVVQYTAKAFRANATLTFQSGAPTLQNDATLSDFVLQTLQAHMDKNNVLSTAVFGTKNRSGGSEDFAYLSHEYPSLLVSLVAGNAKDGYTYPPHHPQATFDERALPIGSAIYAQTAFNWLQR